MDYHFNLAFVILVLSTCADNLYAQVTPFYKTNVQIDSMLSNPTVSSQIFAAWDYSFIGEYHKSLAAYDASSQEIRQDTLGVKLLLSQYRPQSAIDYIIERSKEEQVIIINEAHHQPLHRVFTESLLEGLYQNGYRYLGLEALAEDSLINIRKWPNINDGFYTNEPQFGNMIRKALRLGFTVFGYESSGRGKEREMGQATNILKTLKADPNAKLLIHCGFGHIVEEDHPTLGKAMSGLLMELSGIDPFTIDQVELSERSTFEYESPFYEFMQVNHPSVFVNENNQFFSYRPDSSKIDLTVVHPRTQMVSGRPNWLLRSGTWKTFSLENLAVDRHFPYLVAAYPLNETGTQSVPVDQIEVRNNEYPSLILPPGNFILHILDSEGHMEKQEIVIPK